MPGQAVMATRIKGKSKTLSKRYLVNGLKVARQE
jgi:hypothetical protein